MKVNIENIPDDLKPLVKEDMTKQEIAVLGTVLLRLKIEKFKHRLMGWFRERKKFKAKD